MEIFCLLRRSYREISPTDDGIMSWIYYGTILCVTLYINFSFWFLRLSAKDSHPHSLYKFFSDTDLVRPVTIRAASFCSFSTEFACSAVQLSQTIDEYSNKDEHTKFRSGLVQLC